ncbi:MAG: FGGY family carbohydrate kinase [Bacteroidota bacterium]
MASPQQAKFAVVIGLDCSTTGTKAVAFSRHGKALAKAVATIPLYSPKPNYYEQEPFDWWNATRAVLKRIAQQIDPGRISAIAIAHQRETFVPLDKNMQQLRRAIVWLDERCKDEVEPFSRKIGKEKIHRITGKPVDYAPVVYRLAWMKRHEPHLYKKTKMICDVQSYLVSKLTGLFSTSWASADPLGLFDIQKKRWSPEILWALELTTNQLPELCRPGSKIGEITRDASRLTDLPSGIPIIAGGGDGQAAGVGANALSPKCAYLNLGTAVVAGVYGPHYRTSKAFRTMCSCSENGYYYECSLRAGTFAVDWLVQNILGIDPKKQPAIYRQLEQEANQISPGCGGLLHVPYFCGVMNPYWDMNARGIFVGLSSSHQRGHLFRSILEGIAFEQLFAIESVEKAVGSRVSDLIAIGGGATSELWCHILADITGKNVCIPRNREASALGAAIAAAVGAGWYPTFRKAANAMSRIDRIIRPNNENREKYAPLYPVYKSIYPHVKATGIDTVLRG